MSVQRAEVHWARYLDGNRRVVLEADHARIVAEAGAAVFAFHPEWTVTGMCDSDCLACRRLTELITEREKGYEEGKADAEQEHAAAWDRATFDSTAYEQGKRDAAEEARAAERRHWEARFRNAEQAHATALAEEVQTHLDSLDILRAEHAAALAGMYELGKADGHLLGEEKAHRDSVIVHEGAAESRGYRRGLAAAPRTLTADDPEPAVVSVVLDKDGTAGQRVYTDDGVTTIWQFSDDDWCHEWGTVDRVRGPVTLIHDGEATP